MSNASAGVAKARQSKAPHGRPAIARAETGGALETAAGAALAELLGTGGVGVWGVGGALAGAHAADKKRSEPKRQRNHIQ